MPTNNSPIHALYKLLIYTLMSPLRDQAFQGTRKAKISDTEKEALASGSIGFEREILSGHPDWSKLLDLPKPHLNEIEKAFLDGPVEQLCDLLDDWKIRTELKDLPPEVWAFMKEKGFFGMIIPKEYGGLGFSARAHSEVVMKLASRSTTACVTAMVPNSLGPAELLIRYGTDAQKTHYLPRLAKGIEIPSFALTEPDAGSDASSMTANGMVCEREGQLGILLNWEKRYITLSPITTLLGLAFKLRDPDGLLGHQKELGITLALIPVETAGTEIGRRHNPLGIPFMNGPTYGKDVWISLDQIIGGREFAGQGWRMLMECLSVGRCISLPALSVGSAKLVSRMTGAYSRVRKQFKVSINQFEGVEELLARMAGTTYLMEASRMVTLQMLDRGEHPTILSAILKYHMTEYGRKIVNDGMDILGGKAICEGPDNLIGALYHGIPIGITVEGANILTRNMIIFGQGSVRSHPYLLREIEAARLDDEKEARAKFSDLMAQHVRHSVENTFRSLFFGLTSGHFSGVPQADKTEAFYFRHINRLSAAYATLADNILMLLGDSVKRKERISALLGDSMSYLFMASAVLRHYQANGRLEDERLLVHWSCQTLLHQAEESMDRLLNNFPNPVLGALLRPVIFPLGRRIDLPSHRLDRKVARVLIEPGSLRDRLTDGIYLPTSETEPLGKLEQCMRMAIQADALEVTIRQAKKEGRLTSQTPAALLQEAAAQKILSVDELSLLKRVEVLRKQVLAVDDFDLHFNFEEKKTAFADGKRLKAIYPLGTRWNLDIPRTDLVQMVEQAVDQYKDLPCIDSLGKKYNYAEFGALVSKAAAGLQAIGVQKGDKIGLYMANTPYYPILFFAALKAGAIVVNFCPMHTLNELRDQAVDSQTKMMVTLDLKDSFEKSMHLQKEGILERVIACKMEEVLPFFKSHAYRLFRGSQIARPEENGDTRLVANSGADQLIWFRELITQKKAFTPVLIEPEDVAVLQYTGGTTGTPKGAMLTHANLVSNVYQIEEYFGVSANKPQCEALLRPGKERVLATIPYFHIFGMTVAMLSSLKMGSEILILPDPRNTLEILKTIQEKKPTLFPAVPRLLQAICESPKMANFDLGGFEKVISGGAALPDNFKQSFEKATGKKGLIKQGYGLTETSPVAAANPPYGINKSESVGLPLPQTRIQIVDAEDPDRVLTMGEVGEICVSGPQVMKGYYNRPEETAQILRNGWFLTGDLGYLDDDYYLHIVDRKKRLILVNGLNVYPTQIEQAISRHPAVMECMVISVADSRSGEAAKALIRLKAGHAVSAQQIQVFLSEYLSRIELPKHIEFINYELPKTAVGKPDWRTMQEREKLAALPHGDVGISGITDIQDGLDMEQAS
ncbi:acyl-CoA dehydrogenase [Vampirovibrio sp.]|uniref:acyl-CoA dehydrogenase n=1 Tax=Vampirovibrio sp. TaxID=2717857 RepID=UPI003593885B